MLTLRVKFIGQRSRSPDKNYFRYILTVLLVILEVKDHKGQGQRSHRLRFKVYLEDLGEKSRSTGQKCDFRSHLTILQILFEAQRSYGSGSKITWVKVKGHMS